MPTELNWINEHSQGWQSIVMYQRWTGTFTVARYDYRTGRFTGPILCCAGGIGHAHRQFSRMVSGRQGYSN